MALCLYHVLSSMHAPCCRDMRDQFSRVAGMHGMDRDVVEEGGWWLCAAGDDGNAAGGGDVVEAAAAATAMEVDVAGEKKGQPDVPAPAEGRGNGNDVDDAAAA
jgi:hypothetical protein